MTQSNTGVRHNIATPPTTYDLALPGQEAGTSWLAYHPNHHLTIPFGTVWGWRPITPQTGVVYGKSVTFARRFKTYGHNYFFTGQKDVADPVPPEFQQFLDYAIKDSGLPYNGILVNWYQDGKEYISAHSDDEKELHPGSSVYSWTYFDPQANPNSNGRLFRLRSKTEKPLWMTGNYVDIPLPLQQTTLIVMGGAMQKWWTHEVPKTTKPSPRRINITVRCFRT